MRTEVLVGVFIFSVVGVLGLSLEVPLLPTLIIGGLMAFGVPRLPMMLPNTL